MDNAIQSEPDYQAILQRIAQGELTKSIAAELGIGKGALRHRLAKLGDAYTSAIQEQAEAIVENAMAELFDDEKCIADQAIIARTRARVDTAFKYAAARDPARWGQKQTVQIEVDLGPALEEARRRLDAASHTAIIDQSSDVQDAQVIDK